jgi:hypothetical protein
MCCRQAERFSGPRNGRLQRRARPEPDGAQPPTTPAADCETNRIRQKPFSASGIRRPLPGSVPGAQRPSRRGLRSCVTRAWPDAPARGSERRLARAWRRHPEGRSELAAAGIRVLPARRALERSPERAPVAPGSRAGGGPGPIGRSPRPHRRPTAKRTEFVRSHFLSPGYDGPCPDRFRARGGAADAGGTSGRGYPMPGEAGPRIAPSSLKAQRASVAREAVGAPLSDLLALHGAWTRSAGAWHTLREPPVGPHRWGRAPLLREHGPRRGWSPPARRGLEASSVHGTDPPRQRSHAV